MLEPRTLLSAVKIMPLGDSITEGWDDNTRISYRFWLWKKLRLAGYDVDFVGTRTGVFAGTPIYTDWDQNHQGTSGQLADQLAAGVTGWANTAQPDIALLHIGTNDIFQGQSVSSTITDVNHIIDNIRVARPNISILLAKIIPSTQHTTEINQFNAQIPGVVAAKDTPQSRVILSIRPAASAPAAIPSTASTRSRAASARWPTSGTAPDDAASRAGDRAAAGGHLPERLIMGVGDKRLRPGRA